MAALKGVRAQPKNASWEKSVEIIIRSSSQLVYSTYVYK